MTNRRKRPAHEIVTDLLEALRKPRKTNFCEHRLKTNNTITKKYLTELTAYNLIERQPKRKYQITKKGRKLLKHLKAIRKLWK